VIALAWRNLWRQPRRTLLTLSAVAFAALVMVFLLALQVGTYGAMEDNTMGLLDGYAQVQTPSYLEDPGIRHSFGGIQVLEQALGQVPGVGVVAPRAQTYALLAHGPHSVAALLLGVRPEAERRVSRIAATTRTGRYLRGTDGAAVVLGAALARNLGARPGDRLTLLGLGRDGSVAADVLSVIGVFSSGVKDLDRGLAQMPLERFQADFAMRGQVHALAISGDSLSAVTGALPAVRGLLEPRGLVVRDWGELEPGLKDAIRLDAATSLLWYLVLVLVSLAILLNTLLMSVLERTREFAVLLALGMRPGAVARMVWLEILMLVALGLALGIGLGAGAAGWYAVHGLVLPGAEGVFAQWGLPGRTYPELTPFSLLAAPVAIAAGAVLAGVLPLLRLRHLDPVAAMRAV
jgi:putative ABC transport system permease protein